MTDKLSQQTCVPCRGGEPQVTDEEITELSKQIPDWKLIEVDGMKRLRREYKFKNFANALAFTIAVGNLAEEQDHHPRIITEWGKVTVIWWTHVIKGLHRNDFIMAARSDMLYK
jgi:4a-hydroxytetrahydrobiopterin dehydratase